MTNRLTNKVAWCILGLVKKNEQKKGNEMKKLTASDMMTEITENLDFFRNLRYGTTVRDLTDAFNITTAQASQALIWLEKSGVLTSRKMRYGKVYDVK